MFSKGIQAALKSGSKSSDELFDQVDKMLKEGKSPEQPFKKTRKAYKLFVKKDDKLYPLFVNAADEVPQKEFLEADFPDTAFKGKTLGGTEGFYVPTKGAKREKGEKVKKTGDTIIIPDEETRQKLIEAGFITKRAGRTEDAPYGKVTAVAARPGWHSSVNPVAEHLGPQDLKITKAEAKKLIQAGINPKAIRTRGDQYYVKRRAEDHVWAEVDMADDTSDELLEYMAQTGRTDINDKVPVGGSYSYVDGQADGDTWIVGGNMRVNRTLTREEARALQDELGVKDLPYRDEVEAILGRKFAEGGLVGEQNMYKGEQDYLTTASSGADMNQGGTPMMEQQMSFFNEGGLKDEGGSVDPVSGNDVPIGSTKEEVRDDIPAMVSEGEFIFPADVVRYIGLENLMRLRQDAKMGLKKMEAMGQMGNSEEATIPDDMPFDMADIVIVEGPDEPKEMAQGGVIQAQTGTFVTPIFDPEDKDMRPYTNDGGKTVRYIPFLNNSPVYPIPSGYVPLDQATATPEETPEEVAPTEDGGGGGGDREPFRSEFQKAGGWDMDFGDPPDPKKVELWVKEAEKVSTVGNIATGIAAAINPVVGITTHLGTKLNKKGILDNAEIVRGIASEDQIERINNVTERLTDPERKGILSKILGGVVDEIGDALGLSKQEQDVTKTVTTTGVNTEPTETKAQSQEKIDAAIKAAETVQIRDAEEDTFLFPSTVRDEEPLSNKTPPSPTETTDFLQPREVQPVRDVEPISDDKTPPSLTETTDFIQPREVQPVRDITPIEPPKDPLPGYTQIKSGVKGFRDLAGTIGQKLSPTETGTSQLYEDLTSGLQTSRAAEMYQNLTDGLFSTFESTGRGRGRTDEVVKAPEGLSTAYQAGQQRRKSTKVKTDTTDSQAADSAEARKKRKERREDRQDAAKAALRTSKQKTGEVVRAARERGATPKEISGISKEAKKVEEKLKQQAAGITTGFAKGGLASRKKK